MTARVDAMLVTELRDRLDEAIDVYAAAMGYPHAVAVTRRGFFAEHATRPGYLAVAAIRRRRLVGFGYGYTSAPGQWWHEQVAAALRDRPESQIWLRDAFELAELHVFPRAQGRGLGRRMLADLLEATPRRSVLLSTPEGTTRAWALYRSVGFVDVLREHRFPGDERPFAVLGLDRSRPGR